MKINAILDQIELGNFALPEFEYYGAAEPPFRRTLSHRSVKRAPLFRSNRAI